MNIPYSYQIINVDQQSRVMEVVYTSPGRQTMHISARLPFVGESLVDVIEMFSPVAYWRDQAADVVVPDLVSGQVEVPDPEPLTLETAKRDKLRELAEWRLSKETDGITFNGARILTDRESQATINGAFSSLQAGLITVIDWKAANGVWVSIGLQEMTAIARAVAEHVQACFTEEKRMAEEINAMTTIEAVQAYQLPDMVI